MFDDVTLPKRSLEDLHDIVSEVSYIMRLASAAEVSSAMEHDEDILESYLNYAYRLGVPVPKHIDSELFSLLNELGKLKAHFKMPRPLDIAAALGRDLPRVPQSRWGHAYSYPSGHALISRYLAHRLSQDPRVSEDQRLQLFNFANEIAIGRVQLGVHSLQDIRESRRLADSLFTPSHKFQEVHTI